jgi:integrase
MLLALCNRAEEYGHARSMAMQDQMNATSTPTRVPWNKGKLTGAKPPLRPKHVWSIRTKLQIQGRTRDLAMFNLAIDSKLRDCDVVAIRVEDVAASGYTADRATVRRKKTGRPVRFELSDQTRQAVDDYLRTAGKRPGEFLFTGHRGPDRSMTTRQYARLVSRTCSAQPLTAAPGHEGKSCVIPAKDNSLLKPHRSPSAAICPTR